MTTNGQDWLIETIANALEYVEAEFDISPEEAREVLRMAIACLHDAERESN